MSISFTEALEKEYNSWKQRSECPSPFAFYASLSDRIGSDYSARKKAEIFMKVDATNGLVAKFLSQNAEQARKDLAAEYCSVSAVLPAKAYEELLEILAFCADPENCPMTENKQQPQVASVKRKPASQKPAQTPQNPTREPPKTVPMANITPTPPRDKMPPLPVQAESAPVAKATVQPASVSASSSPQPATPATSSSSSSDSGCGGWTIFFLIVAFVILGFVFLPDASWTFWQWVIGIGGGLISLAIMTLIAGIIEETVYTESECSLLFLLPIAMIANFVLFEVFKADYRIIFCCFSVLQSIFHIILTFTSFDDGEECGWGHLIEFGINITVMVLSLVL